MDAHVTPNSTTSAAEMEFLITPRSGYSEKRGSFPRLCGDRNRGRPWAYTSLPRQEVKVNNSEALFSWNVAPPAPTKPFVSANDKSATSSTTGLKSELEPPIPEWVRKVDNSKALFSWNVTPPAPVNKPSTSLKDEPNRSSNVRLEIKSLSEMPPTKIVDVASSASLNANSNQLFTVMHEGHLAPIIKTVSQGDQTANEEADSL